MRALRSWLLPAALLVVCYLWCFPYFASLRSANEVPRVLVAQQIVRAGTFRIESRRLELGSHFDVAKTPDGRWYSNKAPGVSLLAVPVVYVADALGATSMRAQTWLLRVLVITLPCLLFLPFFLRLARRFSGGDEAAARLAVVAYALGCMALPYGVLYFSHALAGVCAGGAFVAAVALAEGTDRPKQTAAIAGFLAGLAMLVDYQSLLAAAAVGVYLLLRARDRWKSAAIALVASLPPVLALLAYHAACFGSPFRTGYSFAADPAHKQGVLGIVGPNREALANALIAPDNGLFLLTPWAILAIVGALLALRDGRRAEAAVCGVVVVAYLAFVGSLVPEFGRAGWSVGPRYIGVAMPFLAWLGAAGFAAAARRPATWALATGLVGAAVIIHVAATVTYPHWPTSFRHPLYELSFRVLGEGLAAPSLGSWAGLPRAWGIAPVILAAAGMWLWAAGAKRLSTLAGVAVAVALVLAYGLLPRTPGGTAKQISYVKSTMMQP